MTTLPDPRDVLNPDSRGARRQRRIAYVSALVGSAIEYYDFLLYGTAASVVFSAVFFSGVSPAIGVVASFATLAVGYVARPLGGILFGHFGDRVGRKPALITSLVVMGSATTLIGVLPSAAQAGLIAPILLITLRLVQGIAVGGEFAGAVLITVEHAKSGNRGLLGSATPTGGSLGSVLAYVAFGIVAALPSEQFFAWGWRIPFLASAVLLVIGLVMRIKLEESPIMARERVVLAEDSERRTPFGELVRTYRRQTLLALGLFLGPLSIQTVLTTYGATHAISHGGFDRQTILNVLIAGAVLSVFGIPLGGRVVDRFGRKAVFVPAVACMALLSIFQFAIIETGSGLAVLAAYAVQFGVLHALAIAAVTPMLAELFPTRIRYTGVSAAWQSTGALAGAAPLAAAALAAGGVSGYVLGAFLGLLCLVSLACVLTLRETNSVDLADVTA